MATQQFLLAAYNDRESLEDAYNALQKVDGAQEMSIIGSREDFDQELTAVEQHQAEGREANDTTWLEGLGVGAVGGGVVGLLISAVPLVIPGLAPLFVVGPLSALLGLTGVAATTVTGATAGAVTGGIVGALTDIGFEEEEAQVYEDTLHSGGYIIAVPVTRGTISEVRYLLNNTGATQVNLVEGTEEYDRHYDRDNDQEEEYHADDAVTLSEEVAHAQKHSERKGKVRLETHTEEKDVSIPVTLKEEKARVVVEDADSDPRGFAKEAAEVTLNKEEADVVKTTRPTKRVRLQKVVEKKKKDLDATVREEDYHVSQT